MKYLKYLFITLCGGLLIALSFFLSSNKTATTESAPDRRSPGVMSMTTSVPVPDQVKFCDKTIRLDRYDMRERYDREINSFTYFHSTTMLLIKRANRYFPIIEPILKEYGIPDDFKYLATIESNLDVRAVSVAKAIGLWQFMPDTGKEYGLEINDQVDERYHVEKSTRAACKFLKVSYDKYGDWATVAASYNGGMGRISSEQNLQMEGSSFDLLLTEETSRYVFRIMAIKEIFSNPYKYGFVLKKENLYPLIPAKIITLTEDVPDFALFAKKYQLTYAQLKDFNPWLRDRKLKIRPGSEYQLAIPDKEDLFYDQSKTKVHDKAWIEE